jgi:DNA-binding winged helix-turn-helix (wHTH) protein
MFYTFGPFELDDCSFQLLCNGKPISLRRRPFDLLAHLVLHRGEVVTHEELLVHVWDGTTVTRDAIAHAVLSLRTALGEHSHWVEAVRGRGYRFSAPVESRPRERVPPTTPIFIGRCEALASLHDAIAQASRGRGSVVLVKGPLGAGRTRLVSEIARNPGGARVALVHGARSSSEVTRFEPVRALVRELRRQGVGPARDLDGLASSLATGGGDVRVIAHQLATTLARLRACEPLVIAIDDADLVDAATRELLALLAPLLVALPVVLVVSVARGRGQSSALEPSRTILVEPFTREEVASLVERQTGQSLEREAAERIHGATGGNAFLLCTPPGVERARTIERWLARNLPPTALSALRALASSDRETTRSVRSDLLPAVSVGLVREDPSSFVHPVVHDAFRALAFAREPAGGDAERLDSGPSSDVVLARASRAS